MRLLVIGLAAIVGGVALSGDWVIEMGAFQEAPQEAPAEIRMEPEITWTPSAPGEGRLFRIRVTASEHTPVMGVHGNAAGEELHFRRIDERVFESFAAAPVGGGPSMDATIRVVYAGGGEDRLPTTIPVEPGRYRHEALTVAPRFGRPPSPEDQERLERDRSMARAAAAAAHRTPLIGTDAVVLPRETRVTSEFGDGRIFNGQVSSRHMGLDLQGYAGDTIRAAARGVVAVVEPFLLAGNVVYLNHGAGILSAYFHQSRSLVAVGDTVQPGQPIGLVGATGRVTGPHLHWVVRYGNTSVDPRSLLEIGLESAR